MQGAEVLEAVSQAVATEFPEILRRDKKMARRTLRRFLQNWKGMAAQ